MSKTLKALLTVMILVVFAAVADAGPYATGDADLDRALEGAAQMARQDKDPYQRQLDTGLGMPPETVDWMLSKMGMDPAGAYMTAKLSQTSGRPVAEVVNAWKAASGQGWGGRRRRHHEGQG